MWSGELFPPPRLFALPGGLVPLTGGSTIDSATLDAGGAGSGAAGTRAAGAAGAAGAGAAASGAAGSGAGSGAGVLAAGGAAPSADITGVFARRSRDSRSDWICCLRRTAAASREPWLAWLVLPLLHVPLLRGGLAWRVAAVRR